MLLTDPTEMKSNEQFINFIRGMSILFDDKVPLSAQAIDITERFINILDDTEETTAIKNE